MIHCGIELNFNMSPFYGLSSEGLSTILIFQDNFWQAFACKIPGDANNELMTNEAFTAVE